MGSYFRVLGLLGTMGLPAFFILHRGEQKGWRRANQVLSTELQQQILKENLQPGTQIDVGQMKVLAVKQASQTLYLVDMRVTTKEPNPLCGAENCLFLGYLPSRQRVLHLYLNPKLPPKVTLIQPIPEAREHLPCLLINQLEQRKIHVSKLCFNGTVYETIDTQILPEVYE
jgi:hypothetical protein